MFRQARWWVSAIFAGITVLSLLGPLQTAAQESGALPQAGQVATVVVDSGLFAEPTTESAQVEWLGAGTEITLLDAPIPSMFDGELWIHAATSQSTGYLPVSVVTTDPADPAVEPEPIIIAWKLVQTASDIPCLSEPRDDAVTIGPLYPGQEVGLTAEETDGWQPVRCHEQNGYVQSFVFEEPVPTAEPTEEASVGEAPTAETPAAADPTPELTPEATEGSETATPEQTESEPPLATETPAADPAATAEPEGDISAAPPVETVAAAAEAMVLAPDPVEGEEEGQVSAIIGGGTGYVRGTDGDGVRCRAGASTVAATITVLPEGAAVTSRGTASGSWQPVYCAGQSGWVWAEFVGNTPGSSSSTGSTGTVRGTNGDWLRCRSSASYSAAVITALAPGAAATIRGSIQSGWVPVVCGGQNGWVHSDYFGTGSSTGSSSSGFWSGQTVHVSGTEGTGVRFRTSASYSGTVISVVMEGSGLTVRDGSVGEWIAVTRNGSNGFIHRDYLAAGAGTSSSGSVGSSDLTAGSHARVTDWLRMRSGATLNAGTVSIASTGTVVKITGAKSNGFYPVSWGGRTGYMHSDYLVWTSAALSPGSSTGPSTTTPVGNAGSSGGNATGQAIVNYALRYIGYPYVWAGRGPAQFDCAGFVYWVMYNTTGVNLVGGVINQYTYGRPVAWGQLLPGDIVNFANTYTTGLSHNGIYIGNNQFVHASNPTDGVIISNLTNSYYLPRWYGARRII